MDQLVKALGAKPEYLSLVTGTHIVEEKKTDSHKLFPDLHINTNVCACT